MESVLLALYLREKSYGEHQQRRAAAAAVTRIQKLQQEATTTRHLEEKDDLDGVVNLAQVSYDHYDPSVISASSSSSSLRRLQVESGDHEDDFTMTKSCKIHDLSSSSASTTSTTDSMESSWMLSVVVEEEDEEEEDEIDGDSVYAATTASQAQHQEEEHRHHHQQHRHQDKDSDDDDESMWIPIVHGLQQDHEDEQHHEEQQDPSPRAAAITTPSENDDVVSTDSVVALPTSLPAANESSESNLQPEAAVPPLPSSTITRRTFHQEYNDDDDDPSMWIPIEQPLALIPPQADTQATVEVDEQEGLEDLDSSDLSSRSPRSPPATIHDSSSSSSFFSREIVIDRKDQLTMEGPTPSVAVLFPAAGNEKAKAKAALKEDLAADESSKPSRDATQHDFSTQPQDRHQAEPHENKDDDKMAAWMRSFLKQEEVEVVVDENDHQDDHEDDKCAFPLGFDDDNDQEEADGPSLQDIARESNEQVLSAEMMALQMSEVLNSWNQHDDDDDDENDYYDHACDTDDDDDKDQHDHDRNHREELLFPSKDTLCLRQQQPQEDETTTTTTTASSSSHAFVNLQAALFSQDSYLDYDDLNKLGSYLDSIDTDEENGGDECFYNCVDNVEAYDKDQDDHDYDDEEDDMDESLDFDSSNIEELLKQVHDEAQRLRKTLNLEEYGSSSIHLQAR